MVADHQGGQHQGRVSLRGGYIRATCVPPPAPCSNAEEAREVPAREHLAAAIALLPSARA
jgi:hypothetical protein